MIQTTTRNYDCCLPISMNDLNIQSLSSTLQNDLPQELITHQILTRLPIKSLIRFKCVSKQWRSIISDPLFSKTHLQFQQSSNPNSKQSLFINNSIASFYTFDYSGYDSGQIIPSESDFEITDDDSPFGQNGVVEVELPSELAFEVYVPECHCVSFVGSCDGLVCLDPGLQNLYIWNPKTRELREIQNPPSFPERESIGGFGYVSSVDDYKIVLCSQEIDSNRKHAQAHVVDLKNEKWREVDVLEGFIIRSADPGVLVDDMVFWCMNNEFGVFCVVGFDLTGEKFAEVKVPDWVQSLENFFLSVIGGCLCVWGESGGILKMDMMKENGDWGSWMNFNLGNSVEDLCVCMVSGFTRAGNLVIATIYGTVFLVYLSQNPPTLMIILQLSRICEMVNYVESLVSPFCTAKALE